MEEQGNNTEVSRIPQDRDLNHIMSDKCWIEGV